MHIGRGCRVSDVILKDGAVSLERLSSKQSDDTISSAVLEVDTSYLTMLVEKGFIIILILREHEI